MEISFSKREIRIKGKQAAVNINSGQVKVGEFVVPGPGEYEISGITVIGLAGNVYRLNVDNVSILYTERKLNEEDKNALGTVNILITPAYDGAEPGLEPNYVIPFGTTEQVSKFTKELGAENVMPVPKLVASAEKLPETTTVVVLE